MLSLTHAEGRGNEENGNRLCVYFLRNLVDNGRKNGFIVKGKIRGRVGVGGSKGILVVLGKKLGEK